jgi:hypothetical protein
VAQVKDRAKMFKKNHSILPDASIGKSLGILETIKSTQKKHKYYEKNDFRLLDHKSFFITDLVDEKAIKDFALRKMGIHPDSLSKQDYPLAYKDKIKVLNERAYDITADTTLDIN